MVIGMPDFHFYNYGICRGCELGKNARNSFPRSNRRSKGILYLVHSNICGTMSATSLSGCLYYMIFIDDLCHNTWIYFLKSKNDTFNKFKELKALVENHTGRHIHSLRIDSGREFVSHDFDDFFSRYRN